MENITNHTTPFWDSDFASLPIETLLIVLNALIFIIGTTGNGFVIFVYFRSRHLLDTTMKVMLHLAITDVTTACIVGFHLVSYVTGYTNSSYLSCMVSEQALTAMMFVSQAVLTIATLDRYISICHNVRYPKVMTKRNLTGLLIIAWIVALLLALLPFLGFNHWNILHACYYSILFHDWIYATYSTIMTVLMFASLILYIKILVKAHKFYQRLYPAKTQGINARTTKILRKTQSIRNGRIMGIVTLVFILFWLPFQIDQYNFGSHFFESFSVISGRITYTLGLLNSVVNPFLYTFQKREFQIEMKKLFKCIRCRNSNSKNKNQRKIPSISQNEENRRSFENPSKIRMPHIGGKVHPCTDIHHTNDNVCNSQKNTPVAFRECSSLPSTSYDKSIATREAYGSLKIHDRPSSLNISQEPEELKSISEFDL